MFSDSLLDDSADRGRRRWSTLLAWVCQVTLVGLAVVLPLWNTSALPRLVSVFSVAGPPPGERPKAAPSRGEHRSQPAHPATPATTRAFEAPPEVPRGIDMTPEPPADPVSAAPCDFCVPGGTGIANPRTIALFRSMAPPDAATPEPPKPAPRLTVSAGVSQGYLIRQVQPVYPAIARAARIQGTVVLGAVINRDGTIQGLHVLGGPPMLVNAAIEAVRQWRYRPYLLSGQPVEVETQISVVFILGSN